MWNKTLIHKHFHRMTASFFPFPAVGFRARKRSRPSLIPFLFLQTLQMELKRVAEVATSLSMEFSRSPAAGANDPRGRNSLPVIFYDLTRALKAITCDISFPQQRFSSAARGPRGIQIHILEWTNATAHAKCLFPPGVFFSSRLQQETFA